MNNYPIATILGGGGFIGRYLVRNLTRKNFRCIIPTRNPFTKTYLKTQAPPGAIEIIKFGQNNFDEIKNAIEAIFKVKVNKVNTSILRGKGKTFKGQYGFRKDTKKAIVTLDEGNTIDSSLEIK